MTIGGDIPTAATPTGPAADDDRPLAGVRVLAIEQYGAGPFASLYLSDMGAEVIKIKPTPSGTQKGGDSARQSGPHFLGENDSQFFQTFNLGKRSIALDLKSPAGRAVFEKLVGTADAVMNNLRGDQPDRLGITHQALKAVKPSIVCAHLSGYGRSGPRAAWPAYDYLMQAEAGFIALTGDPEGGGTRMGLSVVDYLTGLTTAFALTSALFGAMRTGRGRDVDVTLYDVAVHQLTYPAIWYLNVGTTTERRPRGGHPAVVPCEQFPVADGAIYVMCMLPKFWRALCEITGLPDLAADPRFADVPSRFRNRDALAAILDPVFATRTMADWVAAFAGRLPAAPVLSLAQALDNPFLAERGGIQNVDHPAKPGMRVLSNPIRLDGAVMKARPGPGLGADTDALLGELGYDPAAIAALRAEGAVA